MDETETFYTDCDRESRTRNEKVWFEHSVTSVSRLGLLGRETLREVLRDMERETQREKEVDRERRIEQDRTIDRNEEERQEGK